MPQVDAVANPYAYAVVGSSDVTTIDSRGRQLDQLSLSPNSPATTANLCSPGADTSDKLGRRVDLRVNKGGHPDSVSKQRRMDASDSSDNAAPERKGVETNSSGLVSTEQTGSGQELRMHKRENVHQLGLCPSEIRFLYLDTAFPHLRY